MFAPVGFFLTAGSQDHGYPRGWRASKLTKHILGAQLFTISQTTTTHLC